VTFGDAVLAILEAALPAQEWVGRLTPVAVPWSELRRAPSPIFGVQDLPTMKRVQVVGVWDGDLTDEARRARAIAGRDALIASLTPAAFQRIGWTMPGIVIKELPLAADNMAPLRLDVEIVRYP
jgi:hypothetical protein